MFARRMSTPPSTNRAFVWEWVQATLLAVNLAWTTLCLGGYRPETMVVTGVLTCALVAVHLWSGVFVPTPRAHPAGWYLLPFLAYAAINAQWITPVRWLGWRDWMWWAQLIAVFWVVLNGVRSPAPRRVLFFVLVALGVTAVVLACYQRFVRPDWLMLGRVQADQFVSRASGSFGIPNSLAALLLLLIPASGTLALGGGVSAGMRLGWAAIGAFLVFGLVLTISRGAWLGLALALTAWPLASSRWSWRRRIGLAAAVSASLVAFGAGLFFASASVRERLVNFVHDSGETTRPIMWRAAWRLWRERPAVGSGAGSYNVLFEKYRPEQFLNEPQWAHNDYLNTLSDYGVIGFVLSFGAMAIIIWRSARHRQPPRDDRGDWLGAPATRAALVVGLLAFALQLFVDFHFKIPALAMAFATLGALVVQRAWPSATSETMRPMLSRASLASGAMGVALLALLLVVPHFRAEALRYRSRQAIDRLANLPPDSAAYRAALIRARADLAQAVALDSSNAQTWAEVAYADSLWAHVEPRETVALGASAEAAANRALALSPVSGEFWIRRGVARDMQNHWLEGGEDFARALELSPQTALAWYYYGYHLSLNAQQRALAEAAVNFCLRLDPGNGPGLALRHRLAISQKAP